MIEHHSHRIQNAIQRELFKAERSIKIAVAWFTNDLLFQPLLFKLAAGVTVEIILNKDEINCSDENEIDFDAFVNAGGTLRWNDTKQLLHEKFCIIDDNVVIYGSYNWTNKAEYNEESVTITRGEGNITSFYIDRFKQLSLKYEKEDRAKVEGSPIGRIISNSKETSYEKACYCSAIRTGNFSPEWLQPIVENYHKPLHFADYNNLHFYDSIRTIHYRNGHYLIIAKMGNDYFFVDHRSLLPTMDVQFTNYKRYDDYEEKYMWIEIKNKWGLYQTIKKRFVIPSLFDASEILNWHPENDRIRLDIDGIGAIFNLRKETFDPL